MPLRGYIHLKIKKNRFFLFHFLKVYHFKNILSKFHKGMSIIYGDIRVRVKPPTATLEQFKRHS